MHNDRLDDIRIGWRALNTVPEGREIISISVFLDAPMSVRAGRVTPNGSEVLLFDFSLASTPAPRSLPSGKGFNVTYYDIDCVRFIGLVRKPQGSIEIYERMLDDVCSHVLDDKGLTNRARMRRFLDRVRDWQVFMGRSKIGLSRSEEIGLLGELLVLRELLDSSLSFDETLQAWKGPLHGLHDFEFSDGAIEVKSSVSNDYGVVVDVFDASQFDPSVVGSLYLVAIQLAHDKGGISLPKLITQIKQILSSSGSALSHFEHKLAYTGYRDEDSDKYELAVNIVDIKRIFVDEDFPSIRRAKIPNGIFNVRYSIDLDVIDRENLSLEHILAKLGAVKNGTS